MRRCVVTVATGRFIPGQDRLLAALKQQPKFVANKAWRTSPAHWPSHQDKPYAFKTYALQAAAEFYDNDALLLWCDACIVPVRDMEPLWQRIERDGAVFMNNGWNNYEWTADGAYRALFPSLWYHDSSPVHPFAIHTARMLNRSIPHTVGGFFGLNVKHEKGAAILKDFYRLASETNAFVGPWWNSNNPEYATRPGAAPCGPPDVRGHRHDQTALSVLAWRYGIKLTDCPEFFIYGKPEDATDPRTVAVAAGF